MKDMCQWEQHRVKALVESNHDLISYIDGSTTAYGVQTEAASSRGTLHPPLKSIQPQTGSDFFLMSMLLKSHGAVVLTPKSNNSQFSLKIARDNLASDGLFKGMDSEVTASDISFY
ncbi:uncharacterized protein [Hetaerina americana]|uniref:uncharacterized protein n=1 Tax=Hetaerina americana TaxID=62018 RepID=UPI003A7F1AD8